MEDDTPFNDIDESPNSENHNLCKMPRKRLNTNLETVVISPVNLHGVPQHCLATSAKTKLEKIMHTYKTNIFEMYQINGSTG